MLSVVLGMRFRVRLATLMVLVLGSLLACQSASAVELIWKVNGSKLEAGKTKEFTAKRAKNYILNGTASSVPVEIECETQTSEGGLITGGFPGTDQATLNLSKCKVLKPAKCTVTEPIPVAAATELVENTAKTKILDLFKPKNGVTFSTVVIKGASCEAGKELTAELKGTILAEVSPEKSEVVTGKLKFTVTAPKEYVNSKSETKATGLTFAGNEASLVGESSVELTTKEVFGAF
jgi:hypothetical protein